MDHRFLKRIVRLFVYASLLVAVLTDPAQYPQYDWRAVVADLVKSAQQGYAPAAQTGSNIYSPGASAAAPAARAGGVGPGHWNTPDYASLIQGDPGYSSVAASASAARSNAARSRADAVRRALVQFGVAPAKWQSGYGDVDQATLEAARSNPYSTTAQLSQQRQRGSADLAAALGARGVLHGGALTGGEQLLQRNYDTASSDATQRLLDALGGYESGYANTEQSLESQQQAAYGDAASRVASLYPATWQADPVAPVAPNTSYADLGIDTSGQTIYGGGGYGNVDPYGGMIDYPYSPDVGSVIHDTLSNPDWISPTVTGVQPMPVVQPPAKLPTVRAPAGFKYGTNVYF